MKTNRKAKRMADGGVLKETPEQMLARMSTKYGLGDAGKPQAPQPAPAPTPAPSSAPQSSTQGGLMGKATDAIGRRNDELRQVSRYARGGIMPVIGAGTGTSDSVPAVVAGQDVRLSNGEGMAVLPARTMKNKAAVHAIEEIIEATNGKPTSRSEDEGDEGMACGGIAGKRKMFAGGILGQQNETSISGVRRIGNSFTQTDAGPSSDSAPAATAPVTSLLPQSGALLPPPVQSPTTGVVRSGNSFSAAPAAPAVGGQTPTPVVPATQVSAVSPAAPVAQPVAPQQPAAGKDAYGNSTALTQQYQRELDALRAPAKAFAAGAVKSEDELKRKMTEYVVPTPAPTAQEVYDPVNRAAGGIAGAFNSLPEGGVIKRAVAEGESVPTMIGRFVAESNGMSNNGLFGPPDAKLPDSMRVAQSLPAAPVPASPGSVPAVAPQPLSQAPVSQTPQQASYSNEGRVSAIRSAATGIGDTGNASVNPQTGIMAFTDKTFDPTKQKFEPGTGAITNPKTGKTMVLTGADQSAGAVQPAGALAVGRDAYGNSMAITQQLKGELAAAQADNDQAYARQSAGLRKGIADSQDYYKRVQGEADRFTRFSNEADAAALARSLANGGGNARSNAGRIAALSAMQQRDAAAQSGQTARDLAATSGANQLAVVGAQGENQRSVVNAQGANQIANTALAGQNQLAVEDARQSGPEKSLRATKLQGEVEDANAQRAARQGLMSALDSGNQTATEKAWRRGIAAGIVKPEQQNNDSYQPITDPMTGELKGAFNKRSGELRGVAPAASKTNPAPQSAIDALRANPALSDQFQMKYGYLPK